MNDVLKLSELIGKDEYIIPIYQRDFAWGPEELKRLVRDIEKVRSANLAEYYIGRFVTFHSDDYYEVVDGQQRLTALTILLSLSSLKETINLHFEARSESEYALSCIKEHDIDSSKTHIFYSSYRYLNDSMQSIDKDLFFRYLLEHVYILRLELDASTDLNHYFELLNSRKTQSKETDVLYVKLLDLAGDDKDHEIIRICWNALEHFDRFIQQSMAERIWNRFYYGDSIPPLLDSDYNSWWENAKSHVEGDSDDIIGSLDSALLLSFEENIRPKVREENNIPHYSLINFPEFIAISAEIIYKREFSHDDKLFLSSFGNFSNINTLDDVKYFIHSLMRLRFLFDTYIIKMTNNNWNLSRYIDVNDFVEAFGTLNSSLCALESLYAASLDDAWLCDTLSYLNQNPHLSGEELLEYLKGNLDKYSGERYELYKKKYLADGAPSEPNLIIVNGKLQKA